MHHNDASLPNQRLEAGSARFPCGKLHPVSLWLLLFWLLNCCFSCSFSRWRRPQSVPNKLLNLFSAWRINQILVGTLDTQTISIYSWRIFCSLKTHRMPKVTKLSRVSASHVVAENLKLKCKHHQSKARKCFTLKTIYLNLCGLNPTVTQEREVQMSGS